MHGYLDGKDRMCFRPSMYVCNICVCMCVCMHVSMYVCMYGMYVGMYVYIRAATNSSFWYPDIRGHFIAIIMSHVQFLHMRKH